MNITTPMIYGLKIEVVPLGTIFPTEAGDLTIDDNTIASDNTTIWLSLNVYTTLKSQKDLNHVDYSDVEIPKQSIIDSWPQLQRNPTLNADEQKYLEEAIKAERWVS